MSSCKWPISKSNFVRAAHFFCTFLCRCFAQLQRETSRTFLSYTFYRGNVVRVPVHFFSLPLIFTLHWWPLAFLILSPPLQNFHVALPTKKMSPLFFFSRSRSLSPFFSLSFGGLPPTLSFSLSSSCSIFQICGHVNWSKLNTSDNTDTETTSAFRFCL